jgi:hypothetical protein
MTTNTAIKPWEERAKEAGDWLAEYAENMGLREKYMQAEIDEQRAEVARLQAALEAAENRASNAEYELNMVLSGTSPARLVAQQGDGELPPAEHDKTMDRHYLPLPNGWEIQTKGKGSTFRICKVSGEDDYERWQVLDEKLHAPLQRIAEDVRAALAQRASEPPSFSRDPDDDLALDWRVGDNILSASFSADGRVAWAATIAGKSYSGSEQVDQRAGSVMPYGWVNAGTERQQTEYATLNVGPENPWVDTANAFPIYTAPPAAVQPTKNLQPLYFNKQRGEILPDPKRVADPLYYLASAVDALLIQQPDSGRDAALLDWLAYTGAGIRRDPDGKGFFLDAPYHTGISSVDDYKRFATAREAIAAALAAQPSEQAAGGQGLTDAELLDSLQR